MFKLAKYPFSNWITLKKVHSASRKDITLQSLIVVVRIRCGANVIMKRICTYFFCARNGNPHGGPCAHTTMPDNRQDWSLRAQYALRSSPYRMARLMHAAACCEIRTHVSRTVRIGIGAFQALTSLGMFIKKNEKSLGISIQDNGNWLCFHWLSDWFEG